MYQALSHAYENTASSSTGDTRPPEISTLPQLDSSWTEETFAKNQTEKNKLEVELKTYTNNMIKESIRVRFVTLFFYVELISARWRIETWEISTAQQATTACR